jgi:K+-transporting ATPase A subunit
LEKVFYKLNDLQPYLYNLYFLDNLLSKTLTTGEDLTGELDFAASLNAAISFSTSTFWQSHNPENQLSILSQIFALTMQNFLSGTTSIAVFIAFVRGIINNANPYIGNFYNDFLRILCFLLLPAAFIISLFLIAGGFPHDFTGNIDYLNLEEKRTIIYRTSCRSNSNQTHSYQWRLYFFCRVCTPF